MSSGGLIVPSRDYMQGIRRICSERGAKMILDEAQTGVGRTGRWLAADHFDVVPDILTVSKSLGGSIPLSETVVRKPIALQLEYKGYTQISSHLADPFLCAVGLANMEIIERNSLVAKAEMMGKYFKPRLEDLKDHFEVWGCSRSWSFAWA